MRRILSAVFVVLVVAPLQSCGGGEVGDTRHSLVDDYLASRGFKKAKPNKVVFIGIDGASWWFVDKMIEDGELPNLARVKREGARAVLRSTSVYMSPPAWTTMMTGVVPHKHGVYTFGKPGDGEQGFVDVNAEDVVVPTVTDVASYAGRRVASVNVPVTYPVRPVNGIMLSGMMTPKDYGPPINARQSRPNMADRAPRREDPSHVADPLTTAFGDQFNTFLVSMYDTTNDRERNYDKVLLQMEAIKLNGRGPEVLPNVYEFKVGEFSPWIQIRTARNDRITDAWCKILIEKQESGAFSTAFSPTMYRVDAPLAYPPEIREAVEARYGYYLPSLLMPADVIESLAHDSAEQCTWLYQLEPWDLFLRVFTESDNIHHVKGFFRDAKNIYAQIDKAVGEIMATMPEDATLLIASDHGFALYEYGIDLNRVLADAGLLVYKDDGEIDFEQTLVYHNLWHLYFNEDLLTREALEARGVAPGDTPLPRDGLFAHLQEIFAAITHEGRAYPVEISALSPTAVGEPPAAEVKGTYEGYGVQFWNFREPFEAPVNSLAGTADRFWHHRDGIFMAWGKDVLPGADGGTKDIQDVAATVLYLMDLPLSDDLDGRVMVDVFEPRSFHRVSDYSQVDRRFVEEGVERGNLEEKLRNLGYIK